MKRPSLPPLASLLALVVSAQSALAQTSPLPPAATWAERGAVIWQSAASAPTLPVTGSDGKRYTIPVVGRIDFLAPIDPAKVEIEAQLTPSFRTSDGTLFRDDLRELNDPIHGTNAALSGGSFMARPVPLDHDNSGAPLGLKVLEPANPNSKTYNRIGVRLSGTPAGRLLFLYEMSGPDGQNPAWFARVVVAPLPGSPWLPAPESVTGDTRRSHLRKLAVFQLAPHANPADRIPAKLTRDSLKIDFDAAAQGLDWNGLKKWIVANINDEKVPLDRPFVIQLPPGQLADDDRFGIVGSKWNAWGKTITDLTDNRKVWFVGHPQTTIASLSLGQVKNIGFLFCRFTRLGENGSTGPAAARFGSMISLDGENLDFRNNWVECPDGMSDGGILLRLLKDSTILDNLLAASGAPISTPGSTRVISSIIARNWMERGHDAIQMYGGWTDAIVAYNHAAGASGFANREAGSWHLGANLHSDEFQSQANQTDLYPQNFQIFSNFFQFGRHNWPALWAEIGGATQNFIIDGDSYTDSGIYWNIFQNLAPAGHRGIKTIGPDKAWTLANPSADQRNYIENLAIMGNAFLERWDHNNRPPYGYVAPDSGIGGALNKPLFELLNTENLYAVTHIDSTPALFKQVVESRPDPVVKTGWRTDVPTLSDIYEKPILYTGARETGYLADFSRTAYAGHKFLEGFVSPLDYSPQPEWAVSGGGAARLTPRTELDKIPSMPTNLAAFLGDSARIGGFFDEFSGPAVAAKKSVVNVPWRADSPDDGFVLHIKFGSVGKRGTARELFSEKDSAGSYRILLTETDTARFELYQAGRLVSRVESTDTFEDGDHLTMQVLTPYFPTHPEAYYPQAMLRNVFETGIRRIRYFASPTAPDASGALADELLVWMDTSRLHRFFEWRSGEWTPVLGANDSIHACAVRSFSPERAKPFSGPSNTPSLRRDLYPIETGRWHTMHLDGPGLNSLETWKPGDLRWVGDGLRWGSVFRNDDGKSVGAINSFGSMTIASGRPRCFIRHNIDHDDKRADWLWTPDVKLPRGEVTLFGGFDGSYETFRVIRGGQGEYGAPANTPAYRILQSMASTLSFIRPPLDESGRAPGWGRPDIFLKAGK